MSSPFILAPSLEEDLAVESLPEIRLDSFHPLEGRVQVLHAGLTLFVPVRILSPNEMIGCEGIVGVSLGVLHDRSGIEEFRGPGKYRPELLLIEQVGFGEAPDCSLH
jgi:hypothetical protein